ncbi:hypothetical protein ACIBL5_10080 [Streptomyces sp. NPDC050516]|uniref:hypothetical protein n=1 Tax=Streptomyces sp. NPDC050516 TaxID=3365621 RepID=UPI0037948C3E
MPVEWPGALCNALQVAAVIFAGQPKLAEGAEGWTSPSKYPREALAPVSRG